MLSICADLIRGGGNPLCSAYAFSLIPAEPVTRTLLSALKNLISAYPSSRSRPFVDRLQYVFLNRYGSFK